MKKIINLKESLLSMDKDTDCRYDLTNLYEACNLDDKKKRDLAKYVTAYDIEGTNKFLSNEASSMGLMENATDDLSDEEFEAQVTEGFIHMTDENTCNPLVMGSSLKEGDLVYDEETGNKLQVVSIEPNSNWSRNIQFIDTTTNETFTNIVGNNSLWETVVDGDATYEVDDDIDFEFHPIDELTSQLNSLDDEEPIDEGIISNVIGGALKGAGQGLLGEDLNTSSIEQEVKYAMYSILEPIYDTDFVNDYCSVSVEDTEDNVVVHVTAELGFNALSNLGNKLNKIVTKYDPKTYFETETSGRLVCYIRKDQSDDIVDEEAVEEWTTKFNACKTRDELISVYKELVDLCDNGGVTYGTIEVLFDVIDAKSDELEKLGESLTEDFSSITALADDCGKNTFKTSNRDIRFTFNDETSASKFMDELRDKNIHFDELPRGIIKVNKSTAIDESLTEDYIPDDDDYDRIDRNGSDEERLLAAITYQYGVDMDKARKYEKELSDQEKTRALKWYDLRMFPPKIRLQKMKESLNEDNEPEKYIKLDLQEPEYDHFTIGGKEVPYKSHEEAKAHLNDFNLKDYEEELYKYLKSKNMYPEMYVDSDNTLCVSIQWGDWKHDHMYIDSLINNFFFNRGLILNRDTVVTEDDGSDVYSATHYYTVQDVIFSMSMKNNNTLDESVEHNRKYVMTEGVFDDIKNVAKSVGRTIKNTDLYKKDIAPVVKDIKNSVNTAIDNSETASKIKNAYTTVKNSDIAKTVKETDTYKNAKAAYEQGKQIKQDAKQIEKDTQQGNQSKPQGTQNNQQNTQSSAKTVNTGAKQNVRVAVNSNKIMKKIRSAKSAEELDNLVSTIQQYQKDGRLDKNPRANNIYKNAINKRKKALSNDGEILNMDESLNEDFYDDDFTDEEMAGLLGGELMYCPDCGSGRYYDGHCYACGDPEEINESTELSWTDVYEQFSDIIDTYLPDEIRINDEVEKLYNQHKGDPVWDEAYKRWCTSGNDESLNEELWNSSRVSDLVTYYLDQSNVPTNTLAQMIMKQMEEEGSKLPFNITDFYDALYMAVDRYNSDIDEAYIYEDESIKNTIWNKQYNNELDRMEYDYGDEDKLHCYIFSEDDDGDWGYTVYIKNGSKTLYHTYFSATKIDTVKEWAENELQKYTKSNDILSEDSVSNESSTRNNKYTWNDLYNYNYQFMYRWRGSPNPTYADDLLEYANLNGCIYLHINPAYGNRFGSIFICKDKSSYDKLVNTIENNKILSGFFEFTPLTPFNVSNIVNILEKTARFTREDFESMSKTRQKELAKRCSDYVTIENYYGPICRLSLGDYYLQINDGLNEGWVTSLSDATKDLSPMDKDGFYKVMDNLTCDPSNCPLDQLENEVGEIASRYTDGNASPDYEGEDFYNDEYSGSKIYNAILKLYGRDNGLNESKSITIKDDMFYDVVNNCDDEEISLYTELGWNDGKNIIIPKGTQLNYINTTNPGGAGYHQFKVPNRDDIISFVNDDEEINKLLGE